MKRFVVFLLTMCSFTLAHAQEWWANPYLTEDEKRIDDKTKDDAYLAPTSKLVGKKWYQGEARYYIYNSNGTGEYVTMKYNFHNDVKYIVFFTTPIRWKRNKSIMDITWLGKLQTIKPDASTISKFSLRVQDEIKRELAKMQIEERNKSNTDNEEWEIVKLTNDFLYFSVSYTEYGKKKSGTLGFMTQKKLYETRAKYYNQVAYDELGKGIYDEAIAKIDEAIKLQPKDPNYYDSKGEILYKKGDKEGAKAMWDKVISLDPKYGEKKTELYKLLYPSN